MIRPTVPADTPVLMELAAGTGVFKPHEIEALKEVLNDFHAYNHQHGHRCVTREERGKVIGFAYYAPAAMTDRTWYLYWIAVSKTIQAKGVGRELLAHLENEIRQLGGRVLFIETSSLPHYDLTRKFYLKNGYDQEATLRDYYADGDGMVVFRKKLSEGS
jgi:ribosomal protein S18 acetylase RimI-like enzyme